MGSGIAEVAAAGGYEVLVRSRSEASAKSMRIDLEASLKKQVDKGTRTEEESRDILARIKTTTNLSDLNDSDLVIESVVEDLAIKKALFAKLDEVCKKETVLASDTSTLPVVELAMATGRPDRVCGIHFFNPARVMTLVELVRPITASDETMALAREFASACGKESIEVKDEAGFVVNALLFPYLNNAVRLLARGVAQKADIDAAMVGACGFPMGPLALLDLVGIDTSVAILDALYAEHKDPHCAPAPLLREMLAANLLGRKSGRGFYEYGS